MLATILDMVVVVPVVETVIGKSDALSVIQLTRYPVAAATPSQFKIILFGIDKQSVTTVTPPGG